MDDNERREIWENFEKTTAHWEKAFKTTDEEYAAMKQLFDETEKLIKRMKEQEEKIMQEMKANPKFSEELKKAQSEIEHANKVDRPAGYYTAAVIYRKLGLLSMTQDCYGMAASIAMDCGANWRNHLLEQEEIKRIIKLQAMVNIFNRRHWSSSLIEKFYNNLPETDRKNMRRIKRSLIS